VAVVDFPVAVVAAAVAAAGDSRTHFTRKGLTLFVLMYQRTE